MSKFNKKIHKPRKQQNVSVDKLSTLSANKELDRHHVAHRTSKYYKKLQSMVGKLLGRN